MGALSGYAAGLAGLLVLPGLSVGTAPSAGPAPFGPAGGAAAASRTALAASTDPVTVRGITISCQTYGPEWGTPAFADELDELRTLGANWVAIHPYAGIRADGSVVDWSDGEELPDWLTSPVRVARERGLKLLVKPHLAYWGSPFSWRGDIDFPDPEHRARFFASYREWIVSLARALGDVDAFAVGTELDRLIEHEAEWRAIVTDVRAVTGAKLTYAANWTDYQRVPFWDALDAIGVQAYFPLVEGVDEGVEIAAGARGELPGESELLEGWRRALAPLAELHRTTGKPVVFTELGYNVSLAAASRPWEYASASPAQRSDALELQARCFRVALRVLDEEREWLRGAFLWKWFVGSAPRANFLLDTADVRAVIAEEWRRPG